MNSIKRRLSRLHARLFGNSYYNLIAFFRNTWKFRKALKEYRNWDYSGLCLMIAAMTQDMSEAHKEDELHKNSDKSARELAIISNIFYRVAEDAYCTKDLILGEGPNPIGHFKNKPNTLPSYKAKKFYYRNREQQAKDELSLACKMLARKLRSYWI